MIDIDEDDSTTYIIHPAIVLYNTSVFTIRKKAPYRLIHIVYIDQHFDHAYEQ